MFDSDIHSRLTNEMSRLSYEQQAEVFHFARTLSEKRAAVPGKSLLRFAGTISEEDCRAMEAAIDEGCERIDGDEW